MTQYYQIICRLCGTAHGIRSDHPQGKPHVRMNKRSYWQDTLDFDPDKPLGVIQESLGQGTILPGGHLRSHRRSHRRLPFL